MKYFAILFMLLFTSPALPVAETIFSFVWVTAGPEGWRTEKGLARVTWKGKNFKANIQGEGSTEFRLIGTIAKNRARAKFNALETDFWVDAPFSGSYH